jgi:hypothetical protein
MLKHEVEVADWLMSAYSGAFRPPIPIDSGRSFRSIPATPLTREPGDAG